MKLKTNKSAAKRFRATSTEKIVGKKAGRGHLLIQKAKRQKKLANKPKIMQKGDAKRIAKLIPGLKLKKRNKPLSNPVKNTQENKTSPKTAQKEVKIAKEKSLEKESKE